MNTRASSSKRQDQTNVLFEKHIKCVAMKKVGKSPKSGEASGNIKPEVQKLQNS